MLEALLARPSTTTAATTSAAATYRADSFDGGARTPAPVPRSPEQVLREHNEFVGELARYATLHRGGGF